jgi:RHS repeat-associated protein
MFEVVAGSHTASPPCFDADFYPFGGEHDFTNSCPQNYKFMGKERDPETNNDDFGARSYASAYGRFLSADWSSTPSPVPYANLTNPQTLNLYAMVSDNPESFADLDGHENYTQSNAAPGACTDSGTTACAAQQQAAAQSAAAAQNQSSQDQNQQASAAPMAVPLLARILAGAEEGAEAGGAGGSVEPGGGTAVGALLGAAIGVAVVLVDVYIVNKSDGPQKAADAPGVTSGGQATNEYGQKLGASGKPQVNNVDKNTREKANNAANKGSGTVEHRNPSRGGPHFHTQRGDGTKKKDSTHYNYPE